jgi:GntR family transcriptional regulator/MocR family aminotransferase
VKNAHLVHIQFSPDRSLQEQIREHLLEKIGQGMFGEKALPSCRKLAQMLKVSRNTIVLVYERLVDEGFLISQERSGFYPNPDIDFEQIVTSVKPHQVSDHSAQLWDKKVKMDFSHHRNIKKTQQWQDYPYPFLFGQPDEALFPLNHWRECGRLSQRNSIIKDWIPDHIDCDDPMLIKQLQTNVLSKRGITASKDQILVTIGTQNSLYLIAQLLVDDTTIVGIENPGYPDARNIFSTCHANIRPLRVDQEGVALTASLKQCDYVYTTPSHQVPTNVTMSMARRQQLLDAATQHDFVIIEDDYDSEINLNSQPTPSLKSLDANGRVIYVGSLSKSLSPGLRIGFMVGDKALIDSARKLRRLMYRHPPSNNQRTCALFISMGYYDSYLTKIKKSYTEKWKTLRQSIETYLPNCMTTNTIGGSAFWLRLPLGVDSTTIVEQAKEEGILVENGDVHFYHPVIDSYHYLRIGFTGVKQENIEPGIILLTEIIRRNSAPRNNQFWL